MKKIFVFTAALIAAIFVARGCYIRHEQSLTVYPQYTVVVRSGDTLWNIAEGCESNCDIEEVIFIIRKDNFLGLGQVLRPGQKLIIRSFYASDNWLF